MKKNKNNSRTQRANDFGVNRGVGSLEEYLSKTNDKPKSAFNHSIKYISLAFALVLGLFSFISPFSASALSVPSGSQEYAENAHSTPFYATSIIGHGRLDGYSGRLSYAYAYDGPTYLYESVSDGVIGCSSDSNLVSGALSNRYYDKTSDIEKGARYYLSQEATATGNYRVTTYSANRITFSFDRPNYVYLPNEYNQQGYYYSNILSGIKMWYGVSTANLYPDYYGYEIPTMLKATISFSGYNALGEIIDYTYITSTTDNYLFNPNNTPYYEHAPAMFNVETFSDMLNTYMNYNNVYLINSMSLDIELLQATVFLELDSDGNSYTTIYGDSYDNYCNGTIIVEIPTYNENVLQTNILYDNANKLWITPHFNDNQTIFAFWSKLLNIQILPNFKLSYLLTISFAFVIICVFVRMFR